MPPLDSGIRRSASTTSGRTACVTVNASAPPAASATISKSGWVPSIPRNPSRTTDGVHDHQPQARHRAASITGTVTLSAVPAPGDDSMSTEPARASARWRSAVSPNPPECSAAKAPVVAYVKHEDILM